MNDVTHAVRRVNEPLASFALRLGKLLDEAEETLYKRWSVEKAKTFIEDIKLEAVETFIANIDDPDLRYKCTASKEQSMDKLLELIEKEKLTRRKPIRTMDPIKREDPESKSPSRSAAKECNLCQETGHTLAHCPMMPFCGQCKIFGHEAGPRCKGRESRIMAVTEIECTYCKRSGHSADNCYDRMATLYCTSCGVPGHVANRFYWQYKSGPPSGNQGAGRNNDARNRNGNRNGRTNEQVPQGRGRDRTPGRRSEPPTCYGCNEKGHIRPNCPHAQPNQPGNSSRPGQSQQARAQ